MTEWAQGGGGTAQYQRDTAPPSWYTTQKSWINKLRWYSRWDRVMKNPMFFKQFFFLFFNFCPLASGWSVLYKISSFKKRVEHHPASLGAEARYSGWWSNHSHHPNILSRISFYYILHTHAHINIRICIYRERKDYTFSKETSGSCDQNGLMTKKL